MKIRFIVVFKFLIPFITGSMYVLRKVDGFRLNNEALSAADAWKSFTHPGVVSLKEVFTSKEFGEVNCKLVYFSYAVPS